MMRYAKLGIGTTCFSCFAVAFFSAVTAKAQTDNTAYGSGALVSNTTGDYNSAFGRYAGKSNTTGSTNTAVGQRALFASTTADGNTAVGAWALYSSTTGDQSVAVGTSALESSSTGFWNVGLGYRALQYNDSGSSNIGVGAFVLQSNTTGSGNVAIGLSALSQNEFGDDNVALGNAAANGVLGNDNVALGTEAMGQCDGYFNTAVGNYALRCDTYAGTHSGNANVAVGYNALRNNQVDGSVAVGYTALFSNTTGLNNVALGMSALYQNTTGDSNTAVGLSALANVTTGEMNVGLGTQAGDIITTGAYNTSVGTFAGPNTSGLSNTGAFGYSATVTASNTIRIGNSSVTSIGGYAPWSNLSDGRFKTDVKEDVPGVAFISKLKPVTFKWDLRKLDEFDGVKKEGIDSERKARSRYTGFIAQDVATAADQCGFDFSAVIRPENERSHYELSYADFVVPLVKAVQEQQKQIEDLKSTVASLRGGGAEQRESHTGFGFDRSSFAGGMFGALMVAVPALLLWPRRSRKSTEPIRLDRASPNPN